MKKFLTGIVAMLLLASLFVVPALASSSDFNVSVPIAGLHTTIATGLREHSSFYARLDSVEEHSENPTTDQFLF